MSVDWDTLRIIDGGLGMYAQEKYEKKVDGHPLWSGRLIREDPDFVKRLHTEFLDAGADILETISYQLSIDKICEVFDVSIKDATSYIEQTVHIATDAIRENWPIPQTSQGRTKPLVAACIGPYGATLCDMSEYTGSYMDDVTIDFLKSWHRPRIAALMRAEPDLLAIDSIPALGEAEAILAVLREFPNARAWLCFSTLDGKHTCRGEPLEAFRSPPGCLQALGVNCCRPEVVSDALNRLDKGVMKMACPNRGDTFDTDTKTFQQAEKTAPICDYVEEWTSMGCLWIGGCCGSTPADIAQVAEKMNQIRKKK